MGLLAFEDKLKDSEHHLELIGHLEEINSADNLRWIVHRLPFHLCTKFVELVDQIQQAGQRTNISHIAEFFKARWELQTTQCLVDIILHPPSPQQMVKGWDKVADQGIQVDSSTPLQSWQANSTSTGGGKVCLRIVPVKVQSHDDASKVVETYILLDSGSDISVWQELGCGASQLISLQT